MLLVITVPCFVQQLVFENYTYVYVLSVRPTRILLVFFVSTNVYAFNDYNLVSCNNLCLKTIRSKTEEQITNNSSQRTKMYIYTLALIMF